MKKIFPLIIFSLLLVSCAFAQEEVVFDESDTFRICDGVTVDGMLIGGMTYDQAEEVLREAARQEYSRKFALVGPGGKVWEDTVYNFGLVVKWQEALDRAVEIMEDDENKVLRMPKAVDKSKAAPFVVEASKAFDKTEGGYVTRVNTKKTYENLETALMGGGDRADVVTEKTKAPEPTTGFVKLSSYTTKYNAGQRARTNNVSLAAKTINNYVVKPGETFSYNKVVGRRDPSRGYKEAPIFVGGAVEPGMGGGVCQVSTTLYNAVLLADLTVVERHPHSKIVAYAPAGRDATVAYGSLDFKFRNNYTHPVTIKTTMGGGSLSVSVWGDASDKKSVTVTTAKGKGGYTTYKSVNGGAKQVVDTSVYPTAKKTTTTKKKKTR